MGATIKKGLDAIYALVMGVVTIVLRLTPYGILAIMARTVATSDFGAIYNLGKFVIASYAALFIVLIVHLLILTLSGLNPFTYLKKICGNTIICLYIAFKCWYFANEH